MNILTNFPKDSLSKVINITLNKDNWSSASPYGQTITVEGVNSETVGVLDLSNTADKTAYDQAFYANITISEVSDNTIRFTANGEKPTVDLPLVLLITELNQKD